MISFIVSFLLNFFLFLSVFIGVRLNPDRCFVKISQVYIFKFFFVVNSILFVLYLIVFFAQKRWKRWYHFHLNWLYLSMACYMIFVLKKSLLLYNVKYLILFIEIMLINEMFTRDFRKKLAFYGFCLVMLILGAIIHFQWTFYIQYGLAIKSNYCLFITLFIITFYRELWAKTFYRFLFVNGVLLMLLLVYYSSLSYYGIHRRLPIAFRISAYITMSIVMLLFIMFLLKTQWMVLIAIFMMSKVHVSKTKPYVPFLHGDRNKEWSRNFSLCKKDWKSVVFGQRVKLLQPWHNAWLDVWMRMGLVGVILWGAGFVYIYWLVLKNWRHFHLCVFVLVMWLTVSIAATCFMGYVSNFVQIYAIMYFLEYFYCEKLYARFENRVLKVET